MVLFLSYNFFSKPAQKEAAAVAERLRQEGHHLTNQEIPERDRQRPIWSRNKDLILSYYRAKLGMDMRAVKAADGVVVLWGAGKKNGLSVYHSSNLHNASFVMGLAVAMGKPVFFVGKPLVRFHYHPSVVHIATIDDLSWRLHAYDANNLQTDRPQG